MPRWRSQGTADFEGTFSADLGQDTKEAKRGIQRSGFAGMNSVVRRASSPMPHPAAAPCRHGHGQHWAAG